MRIIYGLSGDGRGHASRSKVMIEHLIGKGHQVIAVTSGAAYEYLSSSFNTIEIPCLRIVNKDEQVDVWDTLKVNSERLMKHGFNVLLKLHAVSDSFKPSLVISDFEPFVQFVSRWRRIPLLSIDNQHIMTQCKLQYPRQWSDDYAIGKSLVQTINSFADHFYITYFFSPEIKQRLRSITTLSGPLLRNEVFAMKPADSGHILVYVRTPERREVLMPILKKANCTFIAYGFGDDAPPMDNVVLRKLGGSQFLEDLAACKAVITNGGYSLITEALYLGKPVYSIPTRRDFEQMMNAYYLQELGYGLYDMSPSAERFQLFLDQVGSFTERIQSHKSSFCGNESLFEAVDNHIQKIGEGKGRGKSGTKSLSLK